MEGPSRGRPVSLFGRLSSPSRRSKTAALRRLPYDGVELVYAGQMKLRAEGHSIEANILKRVALGRVPDISKVSEATQQDPIAPSVMYTASEALGLLLNADLSKMAYQELRQGAIDHGIDLYPSYHNVLEAKKECHPPGINVFENGAEVPLQNLLNHTVTRLLQFLDLPFSSELQQLTLQVKYGFDGASNFSLVKQTFKGDPFDETAIFLACLVPLALQDSTGKIIWANRRAGSTLFCRPIRFRYEREDKATTVDVHEKLENERTRLTPVEVHGRKVCFSLSLTMIDGKVSHAITNTPSMMVCEICGVKPREVNNIDAVLTRPIEQETSSCGISPLHTLMRCMENFLKIAYRLDIKEWQARGLEKQTIVRQRKEEIQKKFRTQMGLVIDFPDPKGGTSNDGNTARRFFENHEISASILGLDADLLFRVSALLRALMSGIRINGEAFSTFALQTARQYALLYSWYPMSPSLHKLLLHAGTIASGLLLPIGLMSEEAQESRNKDFRNFKSSHSRRIGREEANRDLFCRLLESSDPFVSCLRARKKMPRKDPIPPEVLALLMPEDCQ